MDKGGHYDVRNKSEDATGSNMMCKYKGQMDKGGHYDVRM